MYDVKRGDIWQLGVHRLMCGNAAHSQDVQQLMEGALVQLVFTSPPYGNRRIYKQRISDWRKLMRDVCTVLPVDNDAQVLINLGVHYEQGEWTTTWIDWVHDMGNLGYKRAAWMVWDKGDGMPILPSFCRPNPAHEFVFLFRKQKLALRKSVACKWHGRDELRKPGFKNTHGDLGAVDTHVGKPIQPYKVTDSVIRLPPEKANRTGHPAVFPVALPSYLYAAYTDVGARVYDPFAGTATCLLAAQKTQRIGYGMEIAPEYVAMALQRWDKTYPDQKSQRVVHGDR